MQSENFDNKIKDSLNQRPPGNDRPEWDKMETLLDRHLPVRKEDRRRGFFILFLFLLLGGGAFFIWKNNATNDRHIVDSKPGPEKSTEPSSTTTDSRSTNLPQNNSSQSSSQPADGSSAQQNAGNTKQKTIEIVIPKPGNTNNRTATKATTNNNIASLKDYRQPKSNKQPVLQPDLKVKQKTSVDNSTQKVDNSSVADNNDKKTDDPQKLTDTQKPSDITKTPADKTTPDLTQSTPLGSQPSIAANSKTPKQKGKNTFFKNLFFTVSAGPDVSAIEFKTGRTKLVVGAGLGYQVSKKFSVRTGFYSGRKVYTANPDEYYPPDNFWAYYPNLKSIHANCKVYEIPLTVDYAISQKNKHSWFVSAGMSSLLMKEETYDYYFKPPSSPTYITYTRTINNQNQHYFSVLNVSGGYTRHINKNLSLRAEPYAKFALGGVGFGKVNLNSGGVLFSAVVKPFAKK